MALEKECGRETAVMSLEGVAKKDGKNSRFKFGFEFSARLAFS